MDRNTKLPIHPIGSIAVLVLVGLTTGCASRYVVTSCSGVAAPVLLGPVDRIGGHKSQGAPTLASVDVEAADVAVYAKYFHRRRTSPSNVVAHAVTSATEHRRDEDVRLTTVGVGGWFFFPLFAIKETSWVRVQGNAVEVGE